MKNAQRTLIWTLSLLLCACSVSSSVCRGPLRPINVHGLAAQGSAP